MYIYMCIYMHDDVQFVSRAQKETQSISTRLSAVFQDQSQALFDDWYRIIFTLIDCKVLYHNMLCGILCLRSMVTTTRLAKQHHGRLPASCLRQAKNIPACPEAAGLQVLMCRPRRRGYVILLTRGTQTQKNTHADGPSGGQVLIIETPSKRPL
jgi:hypothetical protein